MSLVIASFLSWHTSPQRDFGCREALQKAQIFMDTVGRSVAIPLAIACSMKCS